MGDFIQFVRYLGKQALLQGRGILPVTGCLFCFNHFVVGREIQNSGTVMLGLCAVMGGLLLFTEGLRYGLMPVGELVGNLLPRAVPRLLLIPIAVLLGTVIALAEPSIGVLRILSSSHLIQVSRAPFLWALVHGWPASLALAVGLGAGLAAGIGMLRIQYAWPLQPLLYGSVATALGLAAAIQALSATTGDAEGLIGLAWDLGAVTAGPVTVPLILALGAGTARAEKASASGGDGFGIVALVSLFPVIMVLVLALGFQLLVPEGQILITAETARLQDAVEATFMPSHAEPDELWNLYVALWAAVGGLVPLIVVVRVLLCVAGRCSPPNVEYPDGDEAGFSVMQISGTTAMILCVVGLAIFDAGLQPGLAILGEECGMGMAAAFLHVKGVPSSPIYPPATGLFLTLAAVWFVGLAATLAEPALQVVAARLHELSHGELTPRLIMASIATGTATGLSVGLVRLLHNMPILLVVVLFYSLVLFITSQVDDAAVHAAWDAAGVAMGPVSVPLLMSLSLGMGHALHTEHAFGMLGLACIFPILAMLLAALCTRSPHEALPYTAIASGDNMAGIESTLHLNEEPDSPSPPWGRQAKFSDSTSMWGSIGTSMWDSGLGEAMSFELEAIGDAESPIGNSMNASPNPPEAPFPVRDSYGSAETTEDSIGFGPNGITRDPGDFNTPIPFKF